jgi:undecaprenyl-diphosphatase
LLIAVIPSLVFGFFLNDFIDAKLESPLFIAIIMILGGILLLYVDKWFGKNPTVINRGADIDNKLGCQNRFFSMSGNHISRS